ncbi:hypothetical protein Cch01nite_29820 [Cellulomonas chitinilytica]|uniref:Peptidoglycan binding-like domain-containing protein n=1 Tax=Cellulomonas chitinilytica TaxID=398759 RepID=A0A919P5D3_9CELL|nr:peptidoglycan-binding protein [Cellulomonas chitinilytica]GIG22258.1 hypothetical protein Cch01nite_29820 [Cellulomonas chitinilytica]
MSARTTRPRHAKPSTKAPLLASRGSAAAASAVIVAALTAGVVTPALATPAPEREINVSQDADVLTNDRTPTLSLPGVTTRSVLVDGIPVPLTWDDADDTLTLPAEGDGTYAIEVLGDDVDITMSLTVDTTAQPIVLDVDGLTDGDETEATTATVTVDLPGNVGASVVTLELDGQDQGSAADTWELTGLGVGEHTVLVTVTDRAGNVSTQSFSWTVVAAPPVDETAPVIVQRVGPDGSEDLVEGDDVYFAFSADEVVTWAYTLDGETVVDEDGDDVAFFGLGLGDHTLVVTATDDFGNFSSRTITFTIVAAPEAVVPTIGWVSKPDAATTSTSAHFAVTVSEGAHVEYVLDRVEGAQYSDVVSVEGSEFTITGLAVGHHTIILAAVDGDAYSEVLSYEWDVVPAPVAPVAPVTPLAPEVVPAPATPTTVLTLASIPPQLVGHGISAGASGPSVAILQRVVGAAPDGVFGRQTTVAVRAFQRAHGLVADGIVGARTWAAIVDVANGGTGVAPVTSTSVPRAVINRGVANGAHGQAVGSIQRLLGVTSDGVFGSRTADAVRAFQRAHGLVVDGIVGPRTWAALTSS